MAVFVMTNYSNEPGPIGVFDSGFGGLTILKEFQATMPGYDFLYLGDNARAPYGSRSFDVVYAYTLEAVDWLFGQGCHLVIVACNTASAKALRNIQQINLPHMDAQRRVLGVIRPSVEVVKGYTKTGHVGVLGTNGTVNSESYPIEIHKLYPEIVTVQHACPLWVPLVENDMFNNPGADFFIQNDICTLLEKDPEIDTIILGCTHYPILIQTIRKFTPDHIRLLSQDSIVAQSLSDYLHRHTEIDGKITRNDSTVYYTTEDENLFSQRGKIFLGKELSAQRIRF